MIESKSANPWLVFAAAGMKRLSPPPEPVAALYRSPIAVVPERTSETILSRPDSSEVPTCPMNPRTSTAAGPAKFEPHPMLGSIGSVGSVGSEKLEALAATSCGCNGDLNAALVVVVVGSPWAL